MMELQNHTVMSDDDDETLELLRIAALQTLKQKQKTQSVDTYKSNSKPYHNKWGRGFHSGGLGRGTRIGRLRNTNLISIPTVEPTNDYSEKSMNGLNKLVLPQHRYCNKDIDESAMENKTKESSKFSRYDDSENSDSDEEENSDEEESKSDREQDAVKLERTGSLEALMEELEYEISGGTRKNNEKTAKIETIDKKPILHDFTEKKSADKNNVQMDNKEDGRIIVKEEKLLQEKVISPKIVEEFKEKPKKFLKTVEKHRELNEKTLYNSSGYNNRPVNTPFFNPPNPAALAYNNIPYANPYPPHQTQSFPLKPQRAISPLSLNMSALTNIAMAPLSPRSAAFVLQNREIIERRRKSPPRKTSYSRSRSRSPSPSRFRRSKSRSLSPLAPNGRRSPSPKRHLRSKSPKFRQRSSPAGNSRKTKSRRKSPERRLPAKERLGNKKSAVKSVNEEAVKSNEKGKSITNEEVGNDEDAVLLARKRKFLEQVPITEGVIRLKNSSAVNEKDFGERKSSPLVFEGETMKETMKVIKRRTSKEEMDRHTEEHEDPEEHDDEEEEEDPDTLQTNIDDLFSDEDSDNDDSLETRFKLHSSSSRNTSKRTVTESTMPFSQLLLNGSTTRNFEKKLSLDDGDRRIMSRSSKNPRDSNSRTLESRSSKIRSSSGNRKSEKDGFKSKHDCYKSHKIKTKAIVGRESTTSTTVEIKDSRESNKSVELKSRHELRHQEEKQRYNKDQKDQERIDSHKEKPVRRVAIAKDLKENDTKHDSVDDAVNNKKSEVDLRAHLSRKRAERQHKTPTTMTTTTLTTEDVQSRLLHNALDGAVFKKSSKKRKESDSALREKISIRQRLGVSKKTRLDDDDVDDNDGGGSSSVRKTTKKRISEQV